MPLSLTVLGAASAHPGPGRPASGYPLRGGAPRYGVDAGFGTFAELQRHTNPTRLTAIWISHPHADFPQSVRVECQGGCSPTRGKADRARR